MKYAAVLAALLLAGCAAKAPEPAGPALRDPKAMISSAALFDAGRFAGTWHVAASSTAGCTGAKQVWRWNGKAYDLGGFDCSGAKPGLLQGKATLIGPGARFKPDHSFGREPVWLLWVDQDYRVAVLGTPSGHWGMVLSRDLPLRADLATAAREVLDFNGYDVSRIGE